MPQSRLVTGEVSRFSKSAPSLLNINRLRTLHALGWKWLVQTFNSEKKFCMETVHTTDASKDDELRIIAMLGRTATVVDLSDYI